MKKQLSIQKRR